MARIWSTELAGQAGERVELAGWLHRFRQLSRVSFLIVRDGRGLAQVVLEGEAVANPQAPGGIEVRAQSIEVISVPSEPPPFDLYRPTLNTHLPTLLDN